MKAILVFIVICALGLITGLAGGVQWGTQSAGDLCGLTLLFAFMASSCWKAMEEIT